LNSAVIGVNESYSCCALLGTTYQTHYRCHYYNYNDNDDDDDDDDNNNNNNKTAIYKAQ